MPFHHSFLLCLVVFIALFSGDGGGVVKNHTVPDSLEVFGDMLSVIHNNNLFINPI